MSDLLYVEPFLLWPCRPPYFPRPSRPWGEGVHFYMIHTYMLLRMSIYVVFFNAPQTQRTRTSHCCICTPVPSRHVRTYNKYATIVHGLFSISLSLLRRIKYNDHDYYSSWILVFSPFFKCTSYFFFIRVLVTTWSLA